MIDWSQCAVLESDPEKMGGTWVFRGTRVPASLVLRNLKDMSVDEMATEYPTASRSQIEGLLDFVAGLADPVFRGERNPQIRVTHAHSAR